MKKSSTLAGGPLAAGTSLSLMVAFFSNFVQPANAQQLRIPQNCNQQQLVAGGHTAQAPKLPEGYVPAANAQVIVDDNAAQLVRYAREDGRNASLGGEHVSYMISGSGRLLGFTWMDQRFRSSLPQLSQKEAFEIAENFLQCNAPDLLQGMKVLWIAAHDEYVETSQHGRIKLTGMKVKARDQETGLYFWVIVGADKRVMVFERDIFWKTFAGERGTEKWLHDAWLRGRMNDIDMQFAANSSFRKTLR